MQITLIDVTSYLWFNLIDESDVRKAGTNSTLSMGYTIWLNTCFSIDNYVLRCKWKFGGWMICSRNIAHIEKTKIKSMIASEKPLQVDRGIDRLKAIK